MTPMRTPGRRSARILALCVLVVSGLVGPFACGGGDSESERPAALDAYQVPELRFAGSDLLYALRRVAGEAGVVLVLDELRPSVAEARDLQRTLIDVDIPAGPLSRALELLREEGTFFDYDLRGDVLLVRSQLALNSRTAFDIQHLPEARIEANFMELVSWVKRVEPGSMLRLGERRGHPVFRRVEIEIEEGDSMLDVFVKFADRVNYGVRLRRAGYTVEETEDRKTLVASTLSMMDTLKEPRLRPESHRSLSVVYGLASVQKRTGQPIVVFDRSLLGDAMGQLSYTPRRDNMHPLEEQLDEFAGHRDSLRWNRADGLVRVYSMQFDSYLIGRELLRQKLAGGTFEGTLQEFARWLNRNRVNRSERRFMAGELVADAPRTSLEIAEGTSVEEALYAFARSTGEGWVYTVVDAFVPQQKQRMPWRGAYLTRLAVLGPEGDPPRPARDESGTEKRPAPIEEPGR